jgi:GDP-L-fucose synthase
MHEAKESQAKVVDVWGTGTPRREFIYADDLASACLVAIDRHSGAAPINLGTGITTSIAELAQAVREVVGYQGEVRFETSRPDGIPLKGLDSAELAALGWTPRWSLHQGLVETYRGFLAQRPASQSAARS